jgi:hypothetical protein
VQPGRGMAAAQRLDQRRGQQVLVNVCDQPSRR